MQTVKCQHFDHCNWHGTVDSLMAHLNAIHNQKLIKKEEVKIKVSRLDKFYEELSQIQLKN